MSVIRTIHAILGEQILPLLLVLLAILIAVIWKPYAPPTRLMRLFPILVDIQVLLGLAWFIYGLIAGFGQAAGWLRFPFILHPILGFVAAGVAHLSLRPGTRLNQLGRWGPVVSVAILFLTVVGTALAAIVST
jgi:hypothetical protein